ncbi:MAG: CBS domain-containing protein [Myxococcales bacterium]|nr:CBS domain-containing protein [Myxococcales bacterium]
MKVQDIMSRKVVSISADDNLRIVDEIMQLGRVRHLPVVRRGQLVGVVSQRDLLHASLSNVMGVASEEQTLFLEGVNISQVMSSPPISIGPEAPVQEAARIMAVRKIGCLPVIEDSKLAGIVTETDLLRYFAGVPAASASES